MADSIANQFTGLPIENLIAAPLLAAAEGQKSLASTTAQFITEVGMDSSGNTKSVTFNYEDGSKDVKLDVPLLSIINIPSLSVKGKQEKPEGLMKVLDMLNSSIGKTKDAPASGGQPTG